MQGGSLSSTLRAGTPRIADGGTLTGFIPYNKPLSTPTKVSLAPVPRSAPQAILKPTIEKIRAAERGQSGSALKDWITDFYRDGDLAGDAGDQ